MRILRVVGSRVLACDCFVGVYETYGGTSIEVVDQAGDYCTTPGHRPGSVVSRGADPTPGVATQYAPPESTPSGDSPLESGGR
jgi:hypothetical protein